jgi:hypothetical protein
MMLATIERVFGLSQPVFGIGLLVAVLLVLPALPNGRGWKILTSLRVTVWTLAIAALLVFFGSLAQVHEGLFNAQERWFKSWIVVRHAGDVWWVPPLFPGGHLIGAVLFVNLLAAHFKRFHLSFPKFGIQLTHLGIITLLVGQLLTDELAVESHMAFREGETKDYTEHSRDSELFFARDTGTDREEIVSIPEALLARKGETRIEKLNSTLRIVDYQVNGEVFGRKELLDTQARLQAAVATLESQYASADTLVMQAERALEKPERARIWQDALKAIGEKADADLVAAAKRIATQPAIESRLREELKKRFRGEMLEAWKTRGDEMRAVAERLDKGDPITESVPPSAATNDAGSRVISIPRAEMKDMESRNIPYAVIELLDGGRSRGTWIVSLQLRDQEIEIGGQKWRVGMRFERFYLPFSVKLLKTTHEVYEGTEIPKNFQSRVRVDNPATGEASEKDISMNQPLRYAGMTFYQFQMGSDQRNTRVKTSTLQVVTNVSWLAPYAGCLIVAYGLVWQFLWHLSGFLRQRMGLSAGSATVAHPWLPGAATLALAPEVWGLVLAVTLKNPIVVLASAITFAVRVLLAGMIWRGRYLPFIIVMLALPAVLAVPFLIFYRDLAQMWTGPLIAQVAAVVYLSYVLSKSQPARA